jgi:carbon monoxide dehydrogenase subunit G
MSKVVSKIGTIRKNDEEIFQFLSDFRNFTPLVPEDKIKNWQAEEEECHLEISGVGKTGMKMVEKEPNKLVKITSYKETPFDFNLWLQLKQVEENDTKIRITAEAQLSPFLKPVISKHLQKGLDAMVDKMTEFFNNNKHL